MCKRCDNCKTREECDIHSPEDCFDFDPEWVICRECGKIVDKENAKGDYCNDICKSVYISKCKSSLKKLKSEYNITKNKRLIDIISQIDDIVATLEEEE